MSMRRTNRSRGSKPSWVKQLALERIEKLMALAASVAGAKPARAKRYVELARKLSSRYNVTIPGKWKRKFCKGCFAFWAPGKNLKVRARDGAVAYVCTECGAASRIGYRAARKKA